MGTEFPSEAKVPVEKVGIIFISSSVGLRITVIRMYLVDVDGAGGIYPRTQPDLHFKISMPENSFRSAVCVLDSTLYMFSGSFNYCSETKPKSAYKSSLCLSDLPKEAKTEIHTMTEIAATMHHAKNYVKALPVPGGKSIVVYSSKFVLGESGSAFELFDTRDNSFEILPPLPKFHDSPACNCWFCEPGDDKTIHVVRGCSFNGESQLLLQMEFAAFALDLRATPRAWTPLYPYGVMPDIDNYGPMFAPTFETFKGRYVLIPGREVDGITCKDAEVDYKVSLFVHDVGGFLGEAARHEPRRVHQFPLSSLPRPSEGYERIPGMLGLDIVAMKQQEEENAGSVRNTCIVQRDTSDEEFNAQFQIDFCRTDFATLRSSRTAGLSLVIDLPNGPPNDITYFTL